MNMPCVVRMDEMMCHRTWKQITFRLPLWTVLAVVGSCAGRAVGFEMSKTMIPQSNLLWAGPNGFRLILLMVWQLGERMNLWYDQLWAVWRVFWLNLLKGSS